VTGRRLFVPEVVQTSAMDCGPACLKSLLEGFQINVGYDRLREACQTDLDGTSIDTIEVLANELGLEAEQIILPVDHLLLSEAKALPGIVVVRLPNALAHFVVIWKKHGSLLQVMDPANGREWIASTAFLDKVHVHSHAVPAADWREWAASEEFLAALRRRVQRLHVSDNLFSSMIGPALSDLHWRSLAALDATVRMVTPMVERGGIRGSDVIGRVMHEFFDRARSAPENPFQVIPPTYWSVLPARGHAGEQEQLVFRGAVLLRVRGVRTDLTVPVEATSDNQSGTVSANMHQELRQPAFRPTAQLLRMLREDGLLGPAVLLGATLLGAGGVVFEALLYRTLLDLTGLLSLTHQRLGAITLLLAFLVGLLVLDWVIASDLLRIGRKLEIRLRMYLFKALPRLSDRYFSGRPVSDMAERSHAIHEIRGVPILAQQLVQSGLQLVLTTIGIIWLDVQSAPIAVALALFAVVVPFAVQPLLSERDLRFRTHTGALCRYYFDALRGLIPARIHGASDSLRCEHENLLVSWMDSGMNLQRAGVFLAGFQLFVSFGLVAWMLLSHFLRVQESPVALLLVYWALNVPVLGSQVAQCALQYPRQRNLAARLLEPLSQIDGRMEIPQHAAMNLGEKKGVSIILEGVSVRAMGHRILEDLSVAIEPGTHVCIVGSSGAGKSSFVSLLLGFHRPAEGRLLVDGVPLEGTHLESLRRQTAWLDPNIQLWNRSFLENLQYGLPPDQDNPPIGDVIQKANLLPLIEKLPDGLSTKLGESGGLVSGGEGQRVRLGRAMLRSSSRLVILDEPFSSLDRRQRQEFLRRARKLWRDSTLCCITHDLSESRSFDRVLVFDQGRIVEDGRPADLACRVDSRYRSMLEGEARILREVWSDPEWRKLQVESGGAFEKGAHEDEQQSAREYEQRSAKHLLADITPRRSS
jgi:ABC-type bacteriocin/lantibiotic exporter with double-glycine peptidase domain